MVLVASQKGTPSNFRGRCTLASCNIQNNKDNFINFDQVKGLPQYQMKLQWNNQGTLEWTQPNNPLAVSNLDQKVCPNGCKTSKGNTANDFAGLSLSTTRGVLLDGTTGNGWFYAVGTNTVWNKGIPAVFDGKNNVAANSVKLFVFKPETETFDSLIAAQKRCMALGDICSGVSEDQDGKFSCRGNDPASIKVDGVKSYKKQCKKGYTGADCTEDINECAKADDNNCDANADCTNTDGGFTCACKAGFQGDGKSCADHGNTEFVKFDDYQLPGILKKLTCENDDQWKYWQGVDFNGNDLYQRDGIRTVEECAKLCQADQACKVFTYAPQPLPGMGLQYKCWLKRAAATYKIMKQYPQLISGHPCGYNFNPKQTDTPTGLVPQNFETFDNLIAAQNRCIELGAVCKGVTKNKDGKYSCRGGDDLADAEGVTSWKKGCATGYTGDKCKTDIDECAKADDNNCDSNAECTNTDGGFTCACKAGFNGDGKTCTADGVISLKRNNVIKEGFTVEKTWKLTLDIKPNGITPRTHTSVLRVGDTSGGDQGKGARIPALFFLPNSASLHVTASVQGNNNYYINTPALPLKTWTKVEVTMAEISRKRRNTDIQPTYRYTIAVGGKTVHEIGTVKPAGVFQNVKMWASDNFFNAANAQIRNVDFESPYKIVERSCELQTKTAGSTYASSTDTFNFAFSNGVSKDVTATGKWDKINLSSSYNFGKMSGWESVSVTQKGTNGAEFEKFVITCDNGKSVDLVKIGGCKTLWFDPKEPGSDSPCYDDTASDKKTGKLTDIDECANADSNDCDANAQCTNTDGSFTCACKSGFSGDGKSCTDIDECANAASNNCDANADCTNTDGGFTCACKSGFNGDGTSCADADECAKADTNDCDANAACSNTDGGFTCACNAGFSGDGKSCSDIDECANAASNNCDANADCTNTDGGFTCACKSGFSGDGTSCTDADECANADTNDCDANAACSNTDGGFTCVCNAGFSGDGKSCSDIDECANAASNNCDANADCTNTDGGFTCACKSGFSGDGTSCTDADECANADTNDCDENAQCSNTDGGFTCVCNSGYSGDGKTCSDVDECLKSDACPDNSSCNNEEGSFSCTCDVGYEVDGIKCVKAEEKPTDKPAVVKDCPSNDCWTYDEETEQCTIKKDPKCSKLICNWDNMDIELDSDVFGIEDNQNDAFVSEAKPTFSDGKWRLNCPLGSCGMKSSSTVLDGTEYISFSFAVSTASGSKTIDGMEVFIETKITATVSYQCLYKSEVKVSSDEFSVISIEALDKHTNYGSLDNGFEINLYTDEKMENKVTTQNVFIGRPVYVSVDWLVTSIKDIAAFYLDQCNIEFSGKTLALVDRNCYAGAFGAKILSNKVVSSSSTWQFTSFIVGKGQKTMEMKLVCNVKICSTDENKCERNISQTNDQCPPNKSYGYIAN